MEQEEEDGDLLRSLARSEAIYPSSLDWLVLTRDVRNRLWADLSVLGHCHWWLGYEEGPHTMSFLWKVMGGYRSDRQQVSGRDTQSILEEKLDIRLPPFFYTDIGN